jgi:hypothetical protein
MGPVPGGPQHGARRVGGETARRSQQRCVSTSIWWDLPYRNPAPAPDHFTAVLAMIAEPTVEAAGRTHPVKFCRRAVLVTCATRLSLTPGEPP